jgi:hypothetical protein
VKLPHHTLIADTEFVIQTSKKKMCKINQINVIVSASDLRQHPARARKAAFL